ncbi:MAG: nitroreductase [Gammaproteobacteria bacterium]|nr:nitroreductase [Gammaproteobacteria bacterium]MDE2345225.1 nitroreductase [Gammaproteobacteria bacterium]
MQASRVLEGGSTLVHNSVRQAIRERRATRGFETKAVSEALVRELLETAVWAPSANNLQPWSFAVVQDRILLKEISDTAKRRLADDPHWRTHLPLSDPDFDIFYGCGTLIVICASSGGFDPVGDCYLAGQNLMLMAWSMGLATCPVGLARDLLQEEVMKRRLRIPADITPVLPIIVGYASKPMPKTSRHAPRIHAWIK